jgi:uncharacterized repeat protein (TIGR03803 family)
LLLGNDGNLYGVTSAGGQGYGSVLEITTNGDITSLYDFSGGSDGGEPIASLIQGTDGALYGTTWLAGIHNAGTIFRLTTNGLFSVLHSFATMTNWDGSSLDGSAPNGLLLGSDNNFYGTTFGGGYKDNGTVFRLAPDGAFTTLLYFDGANGSNPQAALIQATDGCFYGTTAYGGSNNAGSVFRLSVPPGMTSMTQSNGVLSFCSSGVVGQRYQVQFASCLSPADWQNLGSPISATNSCIAFTDTISAKQRFYRLIQLSSQ